MNDPTGSVSSLKPSRRHLNRSEIDRLLDGLAVGSGRTRETLDAELQTLGVSNINSGEEHLTFYEAVSLHEVEPARQGHVDECQFCRAMVETVYVPDVAVSEFENKVRLQIEKTPRPRSGRLVPWTIAIVAVFAAGVLASAHSRQSTELASLRAERTNVVTTASVSDSVRPRIVPPVAYEQVEEATTPLLAKTVETSPTIAASQLRALEDANLRLNAEIIAHRAELATPGPELQRHPAPETNDRLREATKYVAIAAEILDNRNQELLSQRLSRQAMAARTVMENARATHQPR
jgi:hypothetical protein